MFSSRVLFSKVSTAPSKNLMWLPDMPMTLVSARNATPNRSASAVFRVLPRMTKHEIKEYLTKIYQLPVKKVNTMNYMGKRKRIAGSAGSFFYKYADYKKAVVTFNNSLQDVGKGTHVPGFGDDDNSEDGDDDKYEIEPKTSAKQIERGKK